MVNAIDNDIYLAIVKEVAKRCASSWNDIGETGAFDWRNNFKCLAMVDVMK